MPRFSSWQITNRPPTSENLFWILGPDPGIIRNLIPLGNLPARSGSSHSRSHALAYRGIQGPRRPDLSLSLAAQGCCPLPLRIALPERPSKTQKGNSKYDLKGTYNKEGLGLSRWCAMAFKWILHFLVRRIRLKCAGRCIEG